MDNQHPQNIFVYLCSASSIPASAHHATQPKAHSSTSQDSTYHIKHGLMTASSSLLNNLNITKPSTQSPRPLDKSNIHTSQMNHRGPSPNTEEHRVVYGQNRMTGVNETSTGERTQYTAEGYGYNSGVEHTNQLHPRYNTQSGVDYVRAGYPLQHNTYHTNTYQYNNPAYDHSKDLNNSPSKHAYAYPGKHNAGYVDEDQKYDVGHYHDPNVMFTEGYSYGPSQSHLNTGMSPANSDASANYMDMDGLPVYAKVNKPKTKKLANESQTKEDNYVMYEHSETQVTEFTKDSGRASTDDPPSDDNGLKSSQVVSSQNDPVSLLNLTQPKSILKNKVTFDLPKEEAGSA